MKIVSFTAKIDDDVKMQYKLTPEYDSEFNLLVMAYLNSPDGWAQDGYAFNISEKNASVDIRLSSQTTIRKKCGFTGKLSCAELGGRHMYLNADRWFRGSKSSKLSLDNYLLYNDNNLDKILSLGETLKGIINKLQMSNLIYNHPAAGGGLAGANPAEVSDLDNYILITEENKALYVEFTCSICINDF